MSPGEFRLIHHLAFPEGESVNDRIPQNLCTICNISFDAVVCMVQKDVVVVKHQIAIHLQRSKAGQLGKGQVVPVSYTHLTLPTKA